MYLLPKNLKKEFIYGGHLLSLGASSIVWTVSIMLDKPVAWPILILAYLISQIVYNHDHLSEVGSKGKNTNLERTGYLKKTKNYQIILLVLYVIIFILVSMFTSLSSSILAMSIIAGGVIYTKKLKKLMKKIVGLKNVYTAFFWSVLGFIVVFHYPDIKINNTFLIIVLFIFVRWIVNSAYFDIKDIESDRKKGIATLPVALGLKKTLFYLLTINIFSGLIIIIAIFYKLLPAYSVSLLLFPVYSFYYLSKTENLSNKQLRNMSYVVVDGEYLLWPFILLIGKLFIK